MKSLIYNLFFNSIYFFLNLLNPLIKIRFLQVETRAIGHMSQPMEIHLQEKKFKIVNNFFFDIYFPQNKIANLYLWGKWKTILNIKIPGNISRFFFEPIFFIALKNNNKNMLVPFRHNNNTLFGKSFASSWQAQDINKVLDKSIPLINFSNEEEKKAFNFLNKNNISKDDKIILLVNRDPMYRHVQNVNKISNEYTYRDQDISLFDEAVEYLCSLNYKVIRMGKNMDKRLNIKNPNFLDYAFSNERSDFLDIYLFKICDFVISTGTGLDNVASLFRKKILHVNYADLLLMRYLNSNVSLICPKKFIDAETNKELTIFEIYEKLPKNPNFTDCKDFLKKENIKYKSLNRNEIKYSCIEMIEFLTKGLNSETISLNKKVKEMFLNKYGISFNSNFCKTYSNFLKENN